MMKNRKIVSACLLFIGIPIVLVIGMTLFKDGKYNLISMVVALIACVPFFLAFEKRKPDAREILIIAVMSAITVASRAAFAWIPAFKPVTAFTAITGFKLGPESGFLTGAIAAVASNMFFGQGPWTPFQMFTWGTIGYIAGLLGKTKWMETKIGLILFGIFAGILFSFVMDIWTVMSYDGAFNWPRYIVALSTALPFTIAYAVSNVVFLLLLTKPIGDKLERMKVKYGIMQTTAK